MTESTGLPAALRQAAVHLQAAADGVGRVLQAVADSLESDTPARPGRRAKPAARSKPRSSSKPKRAPATRGRRARA